MSSYYPLAEGIDLHVRDRITAEDAMRQQRTACEILRRLATQPGLILADEVGMGKTFVALAVAASVAIGDTQRRPVVVMVPSSLKDKWPRDFALFSEKCLSPALARQLRSASADSGVEFLKLLDDPEDRRKRIVFLTHGALNRNLGSGIVDKWVKLAVIRRALYRRHNIDGLRAAVQRFVGKLLYMEWIGRRAPDIWERLLSSDPGGWLKILQSRGIDPEGDENRESDDDPIPRPLLDALDGFDTESVLEELKGIPKRRSAHLDENMQGARTAITEAIKELWRKCLSAMRIRLPMLIFDEAHHLKNSKCLLSKLFQTEGSQNDADQVTRGPLGGVFERMLFLTATPFQLGHRELCSVLERFSGVTWDSANSPDGGRQSFEVSIRQLQEELEGAFPFCDLTRGPRLARCRRAAGSRASVALCSTHES